MRRVLVADDDADMRHMLSVILRHAGYIVELAEDGADLVEQAARLADRAEAPALVVSDVHMPGCTGLEALEQIRLLLPHVPVIIITAFGDSITHARARQLGAVAVLDKPFPLTALRDAVISYLHQGDA